MYRYFQNYYINPIETKLGDSLKNSISKYKIITKLYKKIKKILVTPTDLKEIKNIYNNDIPIQGHALLMYITHPFLMSKDDPAFRSHINIQCSLNIVHALNEIGYCVDVIHYQNRNFETSKKYDIVIGIGESFDYGKDYFINSRIKIYFATGLYWLTETYIIYERLLNLKNRKKVTLVPYRLNEPYFGPEKSDVIFSVQNKYTNETYSHLNKPIYYVSPSISLSFPLNYNYVKKINTKTFLWISGGGMVLKGLDLVLEAFSQMPDYKLKICTSVSSEPDFEQLYFKELYEIENIKTYGFVDIGSDEFINITSDCIGVIYPYPEGEISGSLINSMYYGLIPIIAYFSNEEIKDFAELVEGTVDGIKSSIYRVGALTNNDIKNKSLKTLKYVEKHYHPTKESEEWKLALEDVLRRYS